MGLADHGARWCAYDSCDGCGEHTDPLFDFAKSTTAHYVTCSAYGGCDKCVKDKCSIHQVSVVKNEGRDVDIVRTVSEID